MLKKLENKEARVVGAIAAVLLFVCGMLASAIHSYANQSNTWSPTTGQISGLTLTTNYNNALSAIQSCNSGGSAPVNDQTGVSVQGQCWLNTSTTPTTLEQYDGAQWVTLGWIDTVNHQWIPNNAGGNGTLASGATTDLGSVQNPAVSITGAATITSFGSSALPGAQKYLTFTGAATLTNNAVSLVLPNGGANIVTAAGDTAIALATGTGNWRVLSYTRASGLGAGSVSASFLANSAIPYGTPCLNCTLVSSVGANALTVSLKTLAGADPTANDPVTFLVPNGTGGYNSVQQTSALSVTAPSGASLGTVSNQTNRVWVAAFNNSGTPVLGLYNTLDSNNQLVPWDETTQSAGTAIGAGSTSAQTWYTASGVASTNFRVIGLVESQQSTAGLWATGISKTMLFGPGVKRPGEEIQVKSTTQTTLQAASLTTFSAIPNATVSITPQSKANLIEITAHGPGDNRNNHGADFQLSRGTTAATNMIGSTSSASAGSRTTVGCRAFDVPGVTTSQTYALQGASSGSDAVFPFTGNGLMVAREIQI